MHWQKWPPTLDAQALVALFFKHQIPMNCRSGCAACCIAPSISSPIPSSPGDGASPPVLRVKGLSKAANTPCHQLDAQLRCRLFGQPGRPAVCGQLQPHIEMCGTHTEQALVYLRQLEHLTAPTR
jgi:uncharacterized protein